MLQWMLLVMDESSKLKWMVEAHNKISPPMLHLKEQYKVGGPEMQ